MKKFREYVEERDLSEDDAAYRQSVQKHFDRKEQDRKAQHMARRGKKKPRITSSMPQFIGKNK